ncbi:CLUMA_CG009569, isoform A [Clunio marinus]|uniref:CLUMA_CG009569, isoform A n=1 Tax=Clunio marinus TaxID=568069 RepID=A0A1J1I7I1_9DIPT|nr:CLUMA_CG009569, isoform A [Clunio marinus]
MEKVRNILSLNDNLVSLKRECESNAGIHNETKIIFNNSIISHVTSFAQSETKDKSTIIPYRLAYGFTEESRRKYRLISFFPFIQKQSLEGKENLGRHSVRLL